MVAVIALMAISFGFTSSVNAEDLDGATIQNVSQQNWSDGSVTKNAGMTPIELRHARQLQNSNPGNLDKLIEGNTRHQSYGHSVRYVYRTVKVRNVVQTKTVNGVSPEMAVKVNLAYRLALEAQGRATLANNNASNALVGAWQAKVMAKNASNLAGTAYSEAKRKSVQSTVLAPDASASTSRLWTYITSALVIVGVLALLLTVGKWLFQRDGLGHAKAASASADRAEKAAEKCGTAEGAIGSLFERASRDADVRQKIHIKSIDDSTRVIYEGMKENKEATEKNVEVVKTLTELLREIRGK